MRPLRCLWVALIAVAFTSVPELADAETGLFQMKRTWWGGRDHWDCSHRHCHHITPYISTDYHPRERGPNQASPAEVYVGTTTVSGRPAPRFTAPSKFIKDYTYYYACQPGRCPPGYPESKRWYSYWNLKGSFRPNNPYGATMTTTVRFNTTMSNPTDPPLGTGEPLTLTTTWDGRYDFGRRGSIRVTPGPNRFGGTMQFFYGPNHRYYQQVTIDYPYIAKAYGGGQPPISTYHESQVGEFVVGRQMDRYRMTTYGNYKEIIGTTPSGSPEYYVQKVQYISTIVPFTTGMITISNPWESPSTLILTGYDNRTTTTMGKLSGVISLVRPRLVHSYLVPHDPNAPIVKLRSRLRVWQMDFHFLPEPGGSVMIAAGVVALAGLYRRRRRGVNRRTDM